MLLLRNEHAGNSNKMPQDHWTIADSRPASNNPVPHHGVGRNNFRHPLALENTSP
jgi:hypothetical protein